MSIKDDASKLLTKLYCIPKLSVKLYQQEQCKASKKFFQLQKNIDINQNNISSLFSHLQRDIDKVGGCFNQIRKRKLSKQQDIVSHFSILQEQLSAMIQQSKKANEKAQEQLHQYYNNSLKRLSQSVCQNNRYQKNEIQKYEQIDEYLSELIEKIEEKQRKSIELYQKLQIKIKFKMNEVMGKMLKQKEEIQKHEKIILNKCEKISKQNQQQLFKIKRKRQDQRYMIQKKLHELLDSINIQDAQL